MWKLSSKKSLPNYENLYFVQVLPPAQIVGFLSLSVLGENGPIQFFAL